MNIEQKVISIIVENLEEEFDVKPDSDLRDDIGIDSFSTIMIIDGLEDEFGIEIEETDFKQVKIVSDIVNFIKAKN